VGEVEAGVLLIEDLKESNPHPLIVAEGSFWKVGISKE
jgi:hypothetical protein